MTDDERQLTHKIYALHFRLFEIQGEEIAALRQANNALQRSHEVIGDLLTLTARLAGYANGGEPSSEEE